jgi:SAM-dependent methyltransferase
VANEDMKDGWNGVSGAEWVRLHDAYDRMLAPWADLLATTVAVRQGEHVVDIGCGNGATTRQAALAAGAGGAGGTATGVDLSAPMLEQARKRAAEEGVPNVAFVQADAQTDPLGERAGRYDAAISRFGVMFFEDPVAAFANVHAAMAPGGRLAMVSWGPVEGQQWLTLALGAALAHVPPSNFGGGPDEPGMFGLSRTGFIERTLGQAGWTGVEVAAFPGRMLVGGGGSLDATMDYVVNGGPGRALLEGAEPAQAAKAVAAMRAALADHMTDRGVVLEGVALVTTALAS